jgi:hypothetical protein
VLIKRLSLILLSTLLTVAAHAATYTAASCSESNVQSAVNQTSNGDTVIIPACSQTNWGSNSTSDVPLSVNTDITIQGAGQGNTIIGDNIYKGGSGCSANGGPLINWTVTSGYSVRLTALTIVGIATDPGVCQDGHIYIGGRNHSIEIDHVTISPAQTVSIRFVGDLWGVVTSFTHVGNFVNAVRVENGLNWNGFSSWNDLWGDSSWNAAISYGGGQGIYVENSSFTSTASSGIGGATDCFSGGQIVFRYNTVSMLNNQSHGADSDQRHRACRWQEIYNNTYSYSNINELAFVSWIRGGTGVFYNNTITTPSGYTNKIVQVVNCRDASAGCGAGGPNYAPWAACNGSGAYDENSSGNGYRCVDQPGAGTSCLLGPDGGGTTVTVPACSYNNNVAGGWTGSQIDPVYVWNNTLNGSSNNTTSGSTNIASNRDYYVGTPRPGYAPYTYPYPLQGGTTGMQGSVKFSGAITIQ